MKPLSKLHTKAIEQAQTDQAMVKAAALAIIETPMELIKAVLLKYEEAVIEVIGELYQQQQKDEALLRQAADALELDYGDTGKDWDRRRIAAITAIRARLEGRHD